MRINKMFPDKLKDFRDYVISFYGLDAKHDIERSILELAADCFLTGAVHWASKDSLDLERVREIMEANGHSLIDKNSEQG